MQAFQDKISELVDVDIYAGVKLMKKIIRERKIQGKNPSEDIHDALVSTGISYISDIVSHYLLYSQTAQNVLVEYSLLSSTLDPDNRNQLQCCSFIFCEDDSFRERVEQYYTACISKTYSQFGIAIYQHPNFLYDIKTPQNLIKQNKKPYEKTIIKSSDDVPNNVITPRKDNYYIKAYKNNEDIFISSFPLDRPFADMIDEAITYYSKEKAKETELSLINKDKRYEIIEIQKFLHAYCHSTISKNRNEKSHSSVYVSFPVFGSKASNALSRYKVIDKSKGEYTPLQGIGACFIYFEPKESNESQTFQTNLDDVIDGMVYKISKAIRFISANYMFNLGLTLQEDARKESIRTAVSAIMTRNMSHNLGSHYLYYAKKHLERLADDISNKNSPDVRGAARVLAYTQARMDYLATIVSNDKYPYGSVNFKSQIFDELTIDSFSKRHFPHEKNNNRNIRYIDIVFPRL